MSENSASVWPVKSWPWFMSLAGTLVGAATLGLAIWAVSSGALAVPLVIYIAIIGVAQLVASGFCFVRSRIGWAALASISVCHAVVGFFAVAKIAGRMGVPFPLKKVEPAMRGVVSGEYYPVQVSQLLKYLFVPGAPFWIFAALCVVVFVAEKRFRATQSAN